MPSTFSRRQFVATVVATGLLSSPTVATESPCAGQSEADGVVWERTYGEDRSIEVTDAVADGDGYALVGVYRDAETSGRSWLRRVDGDGSEQWRREYGADEWRSVTSVAVTADDGLLLAGTGRAGHGAQFVTKTDADGGEEWTTTVDVSGREAFAVERDDGSVVLGVTTGYPEPTYPHVTVLDEDGEVGESRTFDDRDGRRIRAGVAADGGVVLAGTTDSNGEEGWLWRLAVDGGIEIERSTTFERRIVAADRADGGGLVLAGTNSPWVAHLGPAWEVEWERTEFENGVQIEDVTAVPGGVAACGFKWGSGCARLPWAFRADGDGTAWTARLDESSRDRWNFVLSAGEGDRVAVAGTDYEGENSDATLSLVEEPEASGGETTTTTAAEETSTAGGTTSESTTEGTETPDDGPGTTADESTADGLDGFGIGASVAALTAALGYRVRSSRDDD
jgi:hypothetical protein